MYTPTDQEKRTLRLGAAVIAVYLALFFGWRGWKQLESRRLDYQQLVSQAERLQRQLQPYENKVLQAEKLKAAFRLDPSKHAKLSKSALVAEASAAIQKAALTGGVQLGPIRESPARPSAKELASMQLEGLGPVPAVMALLPRLNTLGYPLVVDSVLITADPTRPGAIKLNLTIVILDYEQWKSEPSRNT